MKRARIGQPVFCKGEGWKLFEVTVLDYKGKSNVLIRGLDNDATTSGPFPRFMNTSSR